MLEKETAWKVFFKVLLEASKKEEHHIFDIGHAVQEYLRDGLYFDLITIMDIFDWIWSNKDVPGFLNDLDSMETLRYRHQFNRKISNFHTKELSLIFKKLDKKYGSHPEEEVTEEERVEFEEELARLKKKFPFYESGLKIENITEEGYEY